MYARNWAKGIVIATLLIGCASEQTPVKGPRILVDDLGRSVAVPVAPARVVSLAPGLTEIVFAAGGGHLLAAVTTADDYPADVASIRKIGAHPLNREAVVGQNPDLVLATDQVNSPHDVTPLSELGIPTYFLRFAGVGEIISAIREVGSLLGSEAYADSSADALLERWKRVEVESARNEQKPRVLMLVGADVLYAFGGDSYNNEMIVAAGGDPITGPLPGQSAILNDEFVLANPPDIIFGPEGSGDGPGFGLDVLLANHPSWDALPAIQSKQVHTLDPDLIFRPGPRVIDATEQLAAVISAFVEGSNP